MHRQVSLALQATVCYPSGPAIIGFQHIPLSGVGIFRFPCEANLMAHCRLVTYLLWTFYLVSYHNMDDSPPKCISYASIPNSPTRRVSHLLENGAGIATPFCKKCTVNTDRARAVPSKRSRQQLGKNEFSSPGFDRFDNGGPYSIAENVPVQPETSTIAGEEEYTNFVGAVLVEYEYESLSFLRKFIFYHDCD